MCKRLARDVPAELRADYGRIAIVHPPIDPGVKDVGQRLAETVIGSNGLK